MKNIIHQILEKYWLAETTLDEERMLRSYFIEEDYADDHKSASNIWAYMEKIREMKSDTDVSDLILNIDNIDDLMDRYTEAQTTAAEDRHLRNYLNVDKKKEEGMSMLFDYYQDLGEMTTDLDIEQIIMSASSVDIDATLEKYYAGETTLEEEQSLIEYFQGNNVKESHLADQPLFLHLADMAAMTTDISISDTIAGSADIGILVNKYWAGETNLEDNERLIAYFNNENVDPKYQETAAVFQYFIEMRQLQSTTSIEQVVNDTQSSEGSHQTDNESPTTANEAKVFSLRKIMSAVAAIFVLGFASITLMQQETSQAIQYKGNFVQLDEEKEAQEAYEITKQALAFLSKNMQQGSNTVVKSVKKAESAKIFK